MTRILSINEFRTFLMNEGKKSDEEKLAILKKKIADWDEEHESQLAKKRNGSSLKKKEKIRKRIAALQKKIRKEVAALNENIGAVENFDLDYLINDVATNQMKNVILTVANCGYGFESFVTDNTTFLKVNFNGGDFEEIESEIPTIGSNYMIEDNGGDDVIITFDLTKKATEPDIWDEILKTNWENQ